jgi:hypothetical protein
MNDFRDEKISERDADLFARSPLSGMNSTARSAVVNRTHRVVRERAQVIAAQRDRERSLWAPLAVSAALVMILCTAVWTVLDQYEAAPMGVPSASNQFLVLLIWFFPVSMALLAMVWFRRTRKRSGREAM